MLKSNVHFSSIHYLFLFLLFLSLSLSYNHYNSSSLLSFNPLLLSLPLTPSAINFHSLPLTTFSSPFIFISSVCSYITLLPHFIYFYSRFSNTKFFLLFPYSKNGRQRSLCYHLFYITLINLYITLFLYCLFFR